MKSNIAQILSLISAILHQFSLYPLFMMSNIIPFMISYLYHLQKESSSDNKSSLTQNDGYFIHPIMSLSMSICCFYGGMVEHYLGPKIVIILGGISISIGDVLFILSKNIILDYFINIFFGVGFAIAMTAAVKNASKYFPNKEGLVNSIAGGFGGNLGSSFFNLIIKYIVSKGDYPDNDDNDMYKKSTAKNYKKFFYIHAGVVLGNAIISSLLLVPYKEKKIESISIENNTTDEQLLKQEEEKHNKENYKLGLKKIFKNIRIYKLLFIFFFTSFLQGFIFTVGFNFGTMDHGDDIEQIGGDEMSIIFTLTSLISSLVGPIFGLIFDKIGFKLTIIIIDLISIINGCLISFTVKHGAIIYGISIILNGCINGGAFSMIFPYVSQIYGFNYAGELYGFVVLSTGISSMISASIYYIISRLYDDKINKDKTYFIIFIIGAILNILAIIIAFFENNSPFPFEDANPEKGKLVTSSSVKESSESKEEEQVA